MIDERFAASEAQEEEERECRKILQAIEVKSMTAGKVRRRVFEITLELRIQLEDKIAKRDNMDANVPVSHHGATTRESIGHY